MKVIVCQSYDEMSEVAAGIVAQSVKNRPKIVLGLPTGSTPIGMYRYLIKMYQKQKLSFKNVVTFNLDEYVGLEESHVNSYRYFMNQNFFDHIDIKQNNINIPDGNSEDVQRECDKYESKIINSGGIDLMILGLGVNGHIGFNEPSSHFPVRTHVAKLDRSTIKANSRFFKCIAEVPRFSITMGIGTILKSTRVLLLANGLVKAPAVKNVIEGPVTPAHPGSILQFHTNVTVVLDLQAASQLTFPC